MQVLSPCPAGQGPLHPAYGQAMIEYLVVTVAVALVLFVPTPLTDNMPLADYLARAVRSFFRNYSFLMSVL
jgi:hypothetical protein